MRSRKKRSPKLTRLEKMTKGLMEPKEEVKAKFTVRDVDGKGRALFLFSRIMRKDSFVLEYEGDVITHDEAAFREKIYEMNDEGCYILFFRFQNRKLAIDATRHFSSYARYLNHSREPNIRFHSPLLLDLTGQGVPRIAAYALKDIHEGDEIVFDYGISDGKISWLRNKEHCHTSQLSSSSNDSDSSSSDSETTATTDRDVVMSIKRTPKRSRPVVPSDYKHPEISYPSSIKGTSLSSLVPSDGYGLRLIPVPSTSLRGKWHIASVEGLGQPLKIMRSVEVQKQSLEVSASPPSVISLSASDESTGNNVHYQSNSSNQLYHHRNPILPFSSALNSTSKVLEWQEKNSTSDSTSDIKILHVASLKPEVGPSSSSTYSSSPKKPRTVKSHTEGIAPCISNIISGSSVPKSFLPVVSMNCASNNDNKCKKNMSPVHHIPAVTTATMSNISPPFLSSMGHSPNTCSSSYPSRYSANQLPPHSHSDKWSAKISSPSDECFPHTERTFKEETSAVQDKMVHKINVDEMITLTDSDEEILPSGGVSEMANRNPVHNRANQPASVHCGQTIISDCNRQPSSSNSSHRNVYNGNNQNPSAKKNLNYAVQRNEETMNKNIIPTRCKNPDNRLSNIPTQHENMAGPLRSDPTQRAVLGSALNEMNIIISHVQSHGDSVNTDAVDSTAPIQGKCDNNMTGAYPNVEVLEIIDDDDLEIISDEDSPSVPLQSDGKPPSPKASLQSQGDGKLLLPKLGMITSAPPNTVGYSESKSSSFPLEKNTCLPDVRESRPCTPVAVRDEAATPAQQTQLTNQEKETMKKIFGPLILSLDSLSPNFVEKAISDHSDFFSVLIGRGVPINEVRRTVWRLFKSANK